MSDDGPPPATPEQLREALLDLERSMGRERELRLESEALLTGLEALGAWRTADGLFLEILRAFQAVLSSAGAFILIPVGDSLVVRAATEAGLLGTEWQPREFFRRVLAGRPAALFDVTEAPEWKHPPALLANACSALHIAVGSGARLAMVVCVHGDRGYFSRKQLRAAARLVPLASQALVQVALREVLEERDHFFTLTLDLMCIVGRDGCVRQANEAWRPVLGLSPADLIGRPLSSLMHPADRAHALDLLRAGSTGGDALAAESRFQCRDGSSRRLAWRLATEAVQGLSYIVARDVTEQRDAELRLAQAQKLEAIGTLSGGVAHHLNNAMAVILGHGERILAGLPLEDPMRRRIATINKAATAASSLTAQLLAFSRQQIIQPRRVDLNAVIRDMAALLRAALGADTQLALTLSEGVAEVLADPGQLAQAITNLALNARDAMPTGGKLTLRTRVVDLEASAHAGVPAGRWVVLSVADTGHGMDAETLAHAFEPFFTTKGLAVGTGLGLATAYGIVKQNGGHIELTSAVGEGTEFTIYLPRTDQTALHKPEPR